MRALWSDRQNCSHNVSQKVKRIRRFSELRWSRGIAQYGATNQSPPKGAGKMVPRENCRKVSKNFLTLFEDFWRFFCPARKLSKSVEKLFDTFWRFLDDFWRGPFPPAPFAIRWTKPSAISSQILARHYHITWCQRLRDRWLAFYRSQKGLSLKNSEKSLKGVPGASRPRGRKNPKKSRKWLFFKFFSRFRPFFNFFSTFFELLRPPGPKGPGTPFQTFFGVF